MFSFVSALYRGICNYVPKAIVVIAVGSFFLTPTFAHAEIAAEQRARLEAQLAYIEAQIAQQQTLLNSKQKERTSLERDVAILDAQIKKSQLSIKARDITIRGLQSEIAHKEASIGELDVKVSAGQESLAQLLRLTRESDETSLVELALSGTFSEFFQDLDSFGTLQRALGTSFEQMETLKGSLTESKQALLAQQSEQEDLRKIQVLEQQSIKAREREKQKVLKDTKGQEAAYQKLIASQKKTAAEIRAALFSFRDSAAIPFGDAYTYAMAASAKTGVRPAIILAIISEESNLGENVGTGSWAVDMHPTRDRPVFAQIVAELGLDPNQMPVSKKPWYGWGGAMGPAQFIPSTWILYKDRIAAITGNNPPNPWDARTAIFATALLMMDNGADEQTPRAERLAALRYLAGWKNASNPAYAFYGDDVMEISIKMQKQIDILQGV